MAIDPHRSWTMSRVKSKDTTPEKIVRVALSHEGLRYRLHVKTLPGVPDMVLRTRKTVVFVHGCFWHGHHCNRGARVPKTNAEYWIAKVSKNRIRDANHTAVLRKAGWRVLVIWECQTPVKSVLASKIRRFFGNTGGKTQKNVKGTLDQTPGKAPKRHHASKSVKSPP